MFDKNDHINPDEFTPETIGMIWGDGSAHATWFSSEPEHIKGINFLPFTGGSLYLSESARDEKALLNEIDVLTGNNIDQWGGLILQYQALHDPLGALQREDDLIGQLETGQSKAGVHSWVNSLNSLGQPTSEIRSNHDLSAVFQSEQTIAYSAYNPSVEIINISFSDGHSIDIEGRTMLTQIFDQTGAILNEQIMTF